MLLAEIIDLVFQDWTCSHALISLHIIDWTVWYAGIDQSAEADEGGPQYSLSLYRHYSYSWWGQDSQDPVDVNATLYLNTCWWVF